MVGDGLRFVFVEIGHIYDEVLVVDAWAIAFGGLFGFGDDVDADDVFDADAIQFLTDHPVAGAEVEHAEGVCFVAVSLEGGRKLPANGGGRIALQDVVDNAFVKAGDLENALVIMKANLLPLVVIHADDTPFGVLGEAEIRLGESNDEVLL